MNSPTEQFRDAIQSAGLIAPADITPDGKLRRFSSNGKKSDDSGWYVLHSEGIPAGSYGDWRTGISQSWRVDVGRALSPQEETAHQVRIEAMRREREAEEIRRHEAAQKQAESISQAAKPATDHPYLTRKGVQSYGLRVGHDGRLIVPLRDSGVIHSLQFIGPDGDKLFLSGGRVSGCYFGIGKPNGTLCIAEGYATGASIHEATGFAVAIAFNAGNLLPVAKAIRAKFPHVRLIVCADDDARTEGNPGLTKARAAAQSVGGVLAVPDFGTEKPPDATDFNDLHQAQGLEVVKRCIVSAKAPAGNDPGGALSALSQLPNSLPVVQITCAADIEPEAVRWLWPGWLARGKFHIFAGQAGTGKTTIAIALAATISTGGRFPDGARSPVGNVVIWSGEDSAKDTLIPRLILAGADMKRVHFIGDVFHGEAIRSFDPATDISAMQDAALKIGDVSLLIVDPVVNAVAGDSHKNGEVRRALQPLADFGEKLNCAILGISHFSKGTSGKDPLERVTGSLAFGALARIVLATAKITEGDTHKRIFCRAKSNIGVDSGGFEYDLHQAELERHKGIFSSYALWGQAVEGSARELLAENEASHDDGESAGAEQFLRDLLDGGAVAQKDAERDYRGAGYSKSTIKRAKKKLGVKSEKSGMDGGWFWSLPAERHEGVHEGDEGVQKNRVNPFAKNEPLRGNSGDAVTPSNLHLRI